MVHVSIDGYEGVALTSNISKGGLLVICHQKISHRNQVEVLIATDNNKLYTIQGKVKWTKDLPENYLIGIELIQPVDKEFLKYIEGKIEDAD